MPLIKSGLSSSRRWTGAVLDGFLHMTNGLDRPQVTDGSTTWNMGIKAPTAKATFVNNTITGNLTADGKYRYYYTYWCSVRNRESGFSPVSDEMSANASSGKGIRITIPANSDLEPGVDYVKVYRNLNGGSLYYYDGIVAYDGSDTTYDSTVADTGLGEIMGELDDDGTTQLDINGLPPTVPYMATKGGRIGMGGRVIYSEGTASVTNGSSSVTLSGANLTDGMDGWRFRIDGDTEEYLITNIDTGAGTFDLQDLLGNSITYQGTTGSGKTYYLYAEGSIFYYSHKDLYGNPMPESFYAFDYYPIATDDGDDISGIGVVKDNWLILKRNHAYTLAGDTPVEFRDTLIHNSVGTCSHWTIANDKDGNAIWMHESGVYITDGYHVKSLSHQPEIGVSIRNIFTGEGNAPFTIREGYFDLSHAVFDPTTNRYLLWVCTTDYMDSGSNSTICDKVLIYDFNEIDGKVIGWYWYDIPATCSCIIHDNNGKPEVWFGDEWGFVKKFDEDATNDGAGTSGTRRGTATGGSTTTIEDSGASFYTTGSGLQGVFVHILSGTNAGEIRRITSNTSTKLTVTPAFSNAIDTTSVYAIGAINAKRKTKIYDFDTLKDKKISMVKMVFDVEDSEYNAYFKTYKNFSSTADSTKYLKLNDSKGYYEARFASNKMQHIQFEYGLHDVDKPMTIKEVEVDVDIAGTPERRKKQSG
mgnify:CR=1 FL=1